MTTKASSSDKSEQQIMSRLRRETREFHLQLESLPYFKVLAEHALPLESYVNQIRALAIIHGVLESELAATDSIPVKSLWEKRLQKYPLLEEDLKFLEPRGFPDNPDSIQAALSMTQKIRLRKEENPVSLLGYLYCFEGSTLGNSMHLPDISSTYQFEGLTGCGYYASYQDGVQESWSLFSDRMNRVLSEPAAFNDIIEAAREAFAGLEELYRSLYPQVQRGKSQHVTRINPEAGNHPIPEDEREIKAALTASDRAWVEFPYYEQRYSLRGKRFSDSDMCWLVTLIELDQVSMQKQIDWIGRVLAFRGMPLIMLEFSLRFLHQELAKAIPEKKAFYDKILVVAETMAERRRKFIPESTFRSLCSEFDNLVGVVLAERYKNAGVMLVSSMSDEKLGLEGGVAALQNWMTDSDRFPREWIEAVHAILQKTQKLVQ